MVNVRDRVCRVYLVGELFDAPLILAHTFHCVTASLLLQIHLILQLSHLEKNSYGHSFC